MRLVALLLLFRAICSRGYSHLEGPGFNTRALHTYDARCLSYKTITNEPGTVQAPKYVAHRNIQAIKPTIAIVFGLHVLIDPRQHQQCTHVVQQGIQDGLGRQVYRKITVLAYARGNGYLYVHEPFDKMQHVNDVFADAKIAEDFFGLGTGELTWSDVPANTTVCSVHYCINNQYLALLRPDIVRRYWHAGSAPKPPPLTINGSNTGVLLVVVHIRREDVPKSRWVPCDYYIRTLEVLTRALPEDLAARLQVVLYTDGRAADVRNVTDRFPHAELRWGDHHDALEVLHAFVTSDILVMGYSAMSWVAGYYSTGVVVYGQNNLDYVPGWWDVRGDVNGSRLERYVRDNGTHVFLRNRVRQRGFM